jgi:DNA-binding NarL/FixJ family response regulator
MGWKADDQTSAVLGGAKVLVVDDEAVIACDMEQLLSAAGAEVIGPAASLKAALALARHARPDAAVLDVQLGADDVIPLADLLTEQGARFLFYSAHLDTREIHGRWPDSEFIAKPCPPGAMILAVQRLLAARAKAAAR